MIHTENSQWAHLIASLGEFSRYVRFTEGWNSKPYSFKAKISTCDIVLSEQSFEWSNLPIGRVNSNKQVFSSTVHLQSLEFEKKKKKPFPNKNADPLICFCEIPLKDSTFHVADHFRTEFHIFTFQFQEKQTQMLFTQ